MKRARWEILSALLIIGVAVFFARVPNSRWERTEAELDRIPLAEFPIDVVLESSEPFGSRWRLFFGNDSGWEQKYSVVDSELDYESVCHELQRIAESLTDLEVDRGDLRGQGDFLICQVTFNVQDRPNDYLENNWLLTRNRSEGHDLIIYSKRPRVQRTLNKEPRDQPVNNTLDDTDR